MGVPVNQGLDPPLMLKRDFPSLQSEEGWVSILCVYEHSASVETEMGSTTVHYGKPWQPPSNSPNSIFF